jgi:hypothetical protein
MGEVSHVVFFALTYSPGNIHKSNFQFTWAIFGNSTSNKQGKKGREKVLTERDIIKVCIYADDNGRIMNLQRPL